ncbi:unnamed protein product [Adineta ricciae]|uniref:F-box domain-containing protein n=1 Tax=Adineta ricciae TaxID=249248 RepID=A0A815A9S1_ADIRI|nr:unnamed protein product [Adineta ricciae]CAF1592295.1 unnamed protein product [Adineta ricciae]
MSLEALPNEVLFDVFKLLLTPDFLQSFSQLNSRFDRLICSHLQNHKWIDLRATTKYHFDLFWTQLLPPLVTQITSLTLSNDFNTPDQVQQFYSHGFTLGQFTSLQSLSLSHIQSNEIMNQVLRDLPQLLTLTHLTFDKCKIDHYLWANIVWGLPKLVYFNFKPYSSSYRTFHTPKVTSSTIKSVHDFSYAYATRMIDLAQRTPQLRHLSIRIDAFLSVNDVSKSLHSITQLNLLFMTYSFNLLLNILRRIPNLTHLKLDMGSHFIDAQIWQGLIQKHMMKLKYLQFRMIFTVLANNTIVRQEVEKVVASFQNSFWLAEHRWFVQCDWNPQNRKCYIYTLPYAFDSFYADFQIYSKSTCTSDNAECRFERVRRLMLNTTSYQLYECLTLSHIHFPSIEHISIELAAKNRFLYMNEQDDASIHEYELKCVNKLQHLIEQYQRLTSLHFINWPLAILKLSQCNIKNVSIFDLNSWCNTDHKCYYTIQQCDQLSRSTLGMQCRILAVYVEDWTCVHDLIMKMSNLQRLNVHYRYNRPNSSETSIDQDLVEWLKKNTQHLLTDITNITGGTDAHRGYLSIERP